MECEDKKQYLVKIYNGQKEIILSFLTEEERDKMKQAILNCVNEPLKYPTISYSDRKDDILFTAEWLKQCIVFYPKNN